MELLRPLVQSSTWQYVVVWRIGDDPSRFIQWVGCCCSSYCSTKNVKQEMIKKEEENNVRLCRDLYMEHPVSSKACEALLNFPSSMPLYSGIHGDVIISGQSKWISHESLGTQVLIPVPGGLVELFAEKHMAIDQKIVDFVNCQFSVPIEQEANQQFFNLLLEDNMPNLLLSSPLLRFNPGMQLLTPLSCQLSTNTHLAFEGSSSGSSTSNELQLPHFDVYSMCKSWGSPQILDRAFRSTKTMCDGSFWAQAQGCDNTGRKIVKRSSKDKYQSKNLVTERNRRKRIKEGLFALRSLVPKISKMDKSSILGDAIEYIGELQKEMKELKEKLKEMEEEECQRSTFVPTLKLEAVQEDTGDHPPTKITEKRKVELEVNQIGKRSFVIKLVYEHRQGGFGKLMNSLDSLGFQVVDANITTLKGNVLNVLTVEGKKETQLKKLRESLIKVIM